MLTAREFESVRVVLLLKTPLIVARLFLLGCAVILPIQRETCPELRAEGPAYTGLVVSKIRRFFSRIKTWCSARLRPKGNHRNIFQESGRGADPGLCDPTSFCGTKNQHVKTRVKKS